MAENAINPDEKSISLEGGEEEPIKLVEPEGPTEFQPGGVKAFGVDDAKQKAKAYKRPLNVNGAGATRCRLFHSKIALSSLEYMEEQINDWLDSEKIEVKHVGHVIGIMEGKRPEPNLLVMVWY